MKGDKKLSKRVLLVLLQIAKGMKLKMLNNK